MKTSIIFSLYVLPSILHLAVSEDKTIIAEDLTAVESRYKVDAKPSPYVPPQPAPDFDYFAPTVSPSFSPIASPSPSSPVTSYFTPTTIPPVTPSTTTTTVTTTTPATSTYRKLFFPTSFKPSFLSSRKKLTTTTTTPATTSSTTTTITSTPTTSPPPFANEVRTTLNPSKVASKTKSYTRPLYSKKNFLRKKPSVYYKVKKNPVKLRKVKKILRPVSYSTPQTPPSSTTVSTTRDYPSKSLESLTQTKSPEIVSAFTPVSVSKKSIKSLNARKSIYASPSTPSFRYSPTTPSSYQSLKPFEPKPIHRFRSKPGYKSTRSKPTYVSSTTTHPAYVSSTISPAYASSSVSPAYASSSVSPAYASTTVKPVFVSTTANEIYYTPEPKRVRSLPLTREQAHLYSSIPYDSTTTSRQPPAPVSYSTPKPHSKQHSQYRELPLTREQSENIEFSTPVKANTKPYNNNIQFNPVRRIPSHYRNHQALNEIRREEKYPAQPYSFSYDIKDETSGTDFFRSEESSGPVTKGSYKVALPDGRIQIVEYIADENGYKATVSYEGEAVFPNPDDFEEEPTRRTFRHSRKVDIDSVPNNNYSFLRNRVRGAGTTEKAPSPQDTTIRPVSLPLRHRLSRTEVSKSLPTSPFPYAVSSTSPAPLPSSQGPQRFRVHHSSPNVEGRVLHHSTPPVSYSQLPQIATTQKPRFLHNANYEEALRDYGIKVDY